MTDQPPVSGKNNVVLYTAFAANVGIAIAKFIAAALTNSSSMLTEAFTRWSTAAIRSCCCTASAKRSGRLTPNIPSAMGASCISGPSSSPS